MDTVKFYKFWPDSPDPRRPSTAINGEIPARAYQHCEPFLVANSLGWLIYPPIDFNLLWDGTQTFIQFEGLDDSWIIVDRIFLPDSALSWSSKFDESLHPALPVFLESFPEKGILQLWSGLFVDTPIDHSLWIRSPINQARTTDYFIVEGVVETDWWAGPLFTNIDIVKTDKPICFRKDKPFLQVVILPKVSHAKRGYSFEVVGYDDEVPSVYLEKMLGTNTRRNSARPGSYRVSARKNIR
ncbi:MULTISPECIES: DUF6065 family protein [unclassified Pseudomonas]|uniref:DUF6065 family protein n=1 Tax=unclassified Pseudomonas TaxID=196821 RepID=UPI00131D520E|nr:MULTISPECIES: DUF6065 family protein [unclassified Pseudomonas]